MDKKEVKEEFKKIDKYQYEKIDKQQSMADIAYNILEINGKPMHYGVIWLIMKNYVGYVSHGDTPDSTLNSELGRDSRFSKYRGIVELKEKKNSMNITSKTHEKNQCPNCGKQIETKYKYCPYCEFALEYYCKKCNEKMEPDWKICPYCGSKKNYQELK